MINATIQNTDLSFGSLKDKCQPFIVFEIRMKHAIVPLFKSIKETPEIVQDYIERRDIPRRKLMSADTVKKLFKQAVINAAAEIANEFSVCVLSLPLEI
jgi:hypothetical protein